jgi:hypothetical protein
MGRLVIATAMPEHDAAQAGDAKRQLDHFDRMRAAELQRNLAAEHCRRSKFVAGLAEVLAPGE